MEKLFVNDPHYEHAPTPHPCLISSMHRHYKDCAWQKRAPWNAKGKLCTSYALPKHKDPLAKSQYVLPAHLHPARRQLQAVSLVFMTLIASHTSQTHHFNITATADGLPSLNRINERFTGVDSAIHLLTYDVKNMYTELPHAEIRESITSILAVVFSIHLRSRQELARQPPPPCGLSVTPPARRLQMRLGATHGPPPRH